MKYALSCVLLVIAARSLALADEPGPAIAEPLLTKSQTLGLVFYQLEEGVPWNLYRLANPEAAPEVRALTGWPAAAERHAAAWIVLGYVGGDKDVETIKQTFAALSGRRLDKPSQNLVVAMMQSLSLMARRGNAAAAEAVRELTRPAFWKKASISWFPEGSRLLPGDVYEGVAQAVWAYSLSHPGDLDQTIASILEGIEDAKLKEYMSHRVSPLRIHKHAGAMREKEAEPAPSHEVDELGRLFKKYQESQAIPNQTSGEAAAVKARALLLSIHETVGAAFLKPKEGTPWTLYRAADPVAKPIIYEILADKSLSRYHAAAYRIVGFIGDAEDIPRLRQAARSAHEGVMDVDQKEAHGAIFEALGLLAARGYGDAGRELKEMAKPDHWADVRFRWAPQDTAPPLDNAQETVWRVIWGYQLANDPRGLEGLIADFRASVPDDKQRETIDRRLNPTAMSAYQRTVSDRKSESLTRLRAEAERLWNGDPNHPLPKSMVPDKAKPGLPPDRGPSSEMPREPVQVQAWEGDAASAARAAQEAIQAYRRICEQLSKGEFDAVLGQVMDNGAPLTADRLKRKRSELVRDLERERELLVALTGEQFRERDLVVERRGRVTVAALDDQGGPVGPVGAEILDVSFRLDGTAGRGHDAFGIDLINPTIDRHDGSLVVVMRKIRDRWYWRPFGW